MGSKILVAVDQDEALLTLHDVPSWFEDWEQVLSRFRFDSELSRLNASAGSPFALSATLWDVLMAAMDAYALTEGLVTPVILEDMLRAGYDRSYSELAQAWPVAAGHRRMHPVEALDEPLARPAIQDLVIDAPRRRICLPQRTGLDFGGIAKGWAATEAIRRLDAAAPTLVSAGGDIAVSGPRADGAPWPIAVEDPFHPGGFLETIYIDSGGVATSGRDRRRWTLAGATMHHVMDPRTGWPAATDIITATVVAATALQAEALAKAVLILGSVPGMERLESIDEAAGILVLQSGELLYSENAEKYL